MILHCIWYHYYFVICAGVINMIESAPESNGQMTYAEAILYCQFCTHNGYTDWRMPTWDEFWQTHGINAGCWYENKWYGAPKHLYLQTVIPVRDIC